tara:strand:- start:60 stop:1688 length:1629 start_codon:yes stop_codon:yes gene_type:complete
MENNAGSFRVNVSLSNITPKPFFQTINDVKVMKACAAFTLPPPQELFSTTAIVSPTTPVYILESIGLSMDTQATPFVTKRSDGSLIEEEADKAAFNITILRKPIDVFAGSAITAGGVAAVSPEITNVVLSLDYPNILWNSEFKRFNPGINTDLDTMFDPYSAYLISVDCGSFAESATELRIDSLLVTMKFRTKLIERDSGATIQNTPQSAILPAAAQYNARYTVPETVATPAANAVIRADTGGGDDGVSGALAKTDVKFLRGLLGGLTDRSRRWGASNIKTDAAYEVISVPMWGNGWYCKGSQASVDSDAVLLEKLPFVGASPYKLPTVDRRIIPIRFPFTVHHVIAFVNYSGKPGASAGGTADKAIDYSADNQWSSAASAALAHKVGVGISSGIRSDIRSSRNVAYAEWNRASIDSFRISRVQSLTRGLSFCQGDLLSIPLVYPSGAPGTGYNSGVNAALVNTGPPVFVGQTNSTDLTRSPMANLPDGADTSLAQDGYEQFIEVRWAIEQTANGFEQMANNEVIIGQGGFQVYIIGKKHLC